jgi:VWFA-related protein
VELVEVDVIAVDGTGRPVVDLRRDELMVLEDGKPRELVSFARVDLPVPPASGPRLLDVSTNERAEDGRLLFLILDDVNSVRATSPAIRAAASELVSRLGPRDYVGLMWVSLDKQGARELTTNHAAILEAIDAFNAAVATIQQRTGFRSLAPPTEQAEGIIPGSSVPEDVARVFNVLRPYRIVTDVSLLVAGLPHRRKAVVYIGGGLRPLGPKALRHQSSSTSQADIELQRAVTAARRANVSVYLLDPRSPLRPGPEEMFEGNEGVLERMRAGDLAALAEATGGFSAVTPIVGAQIDRIISETSSYYLLGYHADPPDAPSLARRFRGLVNPWESFRRIEVRTSRPGIRIRARRGYWPGISQSSTQNQQPPGVSSEVFETMAGLLPRSDLPLRVTAIPFRGRDRRNLHDVSLAVEVGRAASAQDVASGFEDNLRLAVIAYESGTRIRATDNVTATVALRPGKVPAGGADYLLRSNLRLGPGQYQLRIGVQSSKLATAGSVYHDLMVPDFSKRALSLSGIVLGRTVGAPLLLVARVKAFESQAPFVPSLAREFDPGDSVSAFVRTYRKRGARLDHVVVTATVTSLATDAAVWRSGTLVSFSAADEAEYRIELPLHELAPDDYRLTITASDDQGVLSESRHVEFRLTRP